MTEYLAKSGLWSFECVKRKIQDPQRRRGCLGLWFVFVTRFFWFFPPFFLQGRDRCPACGCGFPGWGKEGAGPWLCFTTAFFFFFPLFFPFPAATRIFGARGPFWAGQRRVALPFPSLYFFGAKTGLRSPSGTKQTRWCVPECATEP